MYIKNILFFARVHIMDVRKCKAQVVRQMVNDVIHNCDISRPSISLTRENAVASSRIYIYKHARIRNVCLPRWKIGDRRSDSKLVKQLILPLHPSVCLSVRPWFPFHGERPLKMVYLYIEKIIVRRMRHDGMVEEIYRNDLWSAACRKIDFLDSRSSRGSRERSEFSS